MKKPRPRAAAVAAALAIAIGLVAAPATGAAAAPGETWSGLTPPLSTPWTSKVSPTNALPDYPRPQLARPSAAAPTWLNLNGLWQYQAWDGYSAIPFGKDLGKQILVPYPTESALSGIQSHADYMLYRRTVDVPKQYTNGGKHLRLNFGAVNYDATVYVNGQQVARHLGGYDGFSADITDALTDRGPQEVVVAVHSPVDSATIPVGKQRLNPGGIFYTAASGIWQTVWLEPVQPVSIATLTATPNIDTSSFSVAATFNGDAAGAKLTVDAWADGKKVASSSGAAGGPITLAVRKPHLWSPDDPFLYTFTATLNAHGSTDKVESYAGLRQIAVENVGGKQRITLNHKQTFLLGTLDQGYWPDGIYTAPTDEALKFDIQKTKDLGFNTIRKHIKVEPARWYYWADKLGMMVWQDSPSVPTGRNGSLSTGDKANFRAETARMVDQLKGVTSIIGWIPFNEGWGQWSVQAAADVANQVKAQDPTRLVNARSGANCCDTPGDPGNGDIIDWHVYQGPALPVPDAKRASIDGEHGGLTLPVEGHSWPGADVNPYGAVKDSAALTAGYVANTAVLRDQGAPYGLSGSIYTQITDVEGEQNGFFTYDRQVEKVDEAAVRKVNLETIAAGAKTPPKPPAGTPGLSGVSSWQFDETGGATAADSAGTNPLTVKGGAQWVSGSKGNALQLDGTGSAVSDKTVLKTDGTNYSVSAWVRFSKLDGAFQTIVGEDGDQNSAFFLQWSGADRKLAFSFAGIRALANDVAVQPNVWYHVVGVRDVTASTLTVYVNGAKAGQASVLGNADTATGPLTVGRGKFGGNPVDYLSGAVDDVRAFDRALSADEVAQLFGSH
ncbi:LamG-like jellyroll fold domain-containing protein [Leifsonia sp. SIMBA_070]|uniref:LamG-like jellyroll fold domain-containing protein n=1 Tax=Leifsonia sp. SIMBA_070 TaxID=3085810 RepID=UPI00397D01DA